VGTAVGTPAPPGNVAPVASFTATPTFGTGPLSVNVDASASSDSNCDGPGNCDPLTYEWTWGDTTVTPGTGVAASHVYANPGTYTLTLVVSDPAGYSSSATATITVTGTTCNITAAQFKNGINTLVNDIEVGSSRKPNETQFVISATTNAACTGVTSSIPNQEPGGFTATLGLMSSTSTTKTWGITTSNNDKYNTGTSQSATFTASGGPGPVNFTIAYSVHT